MYRLLNFGRFTFDASDNGLRKIPTISRAGSIAIAVSVLVWILKPDLFGVIPNSLDPMFYTGYAINLNDALEASRNNHYSVTRWSSYLPMYLSSEVFGPHWGRLVLRLAMVLTISEVFWRLGHKFQTKPIARLFGVFALVSTPMFVRAFTTDYPEYFIVWSTIIMLLLTLMKSRKYSHALIMGTLAASAVIANPTSVIVASLIIALNMFLLLRDDGLKLAANRLVLIGLAFTTTFLFGYLMFRFYFDIGNVYEPTLEFIRNFVPPENDGWVSPNNEWLSHFAWVFIPPILCLISIVNFRKKTNTGIPTALLTVLVASIFLVHVIREIQDGYMLEVPYYWSLLLAPVVVLFAVLLVNWANNMSWYWPASAMVLIVFLIKAEIPQNVRLPSGLWLFAVLAVFSGVTATLVHREVKISVLILSLGLLWIQIGSPIYTITTYAGEINSPRYDLVYGDYSKSSKAVLDETIWFTKQMDSVENDELALFLTAGGLSSSIIGTYIAQPSGQWITSLSDSKVLIDNVRDELNFNFRPNLIIYGYPSEVQDLFNRVSLELPQSRKTVDVIDPSGLGYRLIAIDGNSKETAELVFPMTRFHRTIGTPGTNGSVLVDSRSSTGFVSFGPWFSLGQGTYEAELLYESSGSNLRGRFEVFDDVTGKIVSTRLHNDINGKRTSKVRFTSGGEGSIWQLRTVYEGGEETTFHTISLKKLS
jgi:hypothetical protein